VGRPLVFAVPDPGLENGLFGLQVEEVHLREVGMQVRGVTDVEGEAGRDPGHDLVRLGAHPQVDLGAQGLDDLDLGRDVVVRLAVSE